jgi:hypothetical protein
MNRAAPRWVRVIATALAVGAMLVAASAPAAAEPLPLTSDDINFLSAVRGNFPGDDNQLLIAGKQACRQLYTGQPVQAVIDSTAGQYGVSPDQASRLVRAARNTMCTQAPG